MSIIKIDDLNFERCVPGCRDQNDHQDEFPRCSICGKTAWHMYGYKKHKPDINAQKIQGTEPSETTLYWAINDGYTR